MTLIEININNSFNKDNKERTQPQKDELVVGGSTLSNDSPSRRVEVNSINTTSFTNSAINEQLNITGSSKRKTIVREIFIATLSTVMGSLTTYLVVRFFAQ